MNEYPERSGPREVLPDRAAAGECARPPGGGIWVIEAGEGSSGETIRRASDSFSGVNGFFRTMALPHLLSAPASALSASLEMRMNPSAAPWQSA